MTEVSKAPTFAQEIAPLWVADDEPVDVELAISCAHHGRRLGVAIAPDGTESLRCPSEGCAVHVYAHVAPDDGREEDR